ncbi:MAG: 50S ribosomal protein L18e [Thermoplasmata archaeon]
MAGTRKSNPKLLKLIDQLKKHSYENEAPIWKDIAKRLSKPRRNWAQVNISRISRYAKKGEVILVPGKLLGSGQIDVPVTVASFHTSDAARRKIVASGGSVLSIEELVGKNPKGSGVRIMR